MAKRQTAVIDLDWCKYTAASAAEKRTIIATHKASGRQKEFKNVTELWGRGNKVGGWLGEQNEKRDKKWTKEDFDIETIQTPEPIENALHTAKMMVERAIAASGADDYICVLGKGDGHRVDRSTMRKYKDRHTLKPIRLQEVVDYLEKKFKPIVVEDIEADDELVILCQEDPNGRFVIGEDKDNYSQPVRFFNVNRPDEGIIDCRGYGKLWIEEKVSPKTGKKTKKVRGYGRQHLYWQIAFGDDVDTYHANALSEVSWGDVSAYKALKDCTNDKESWEALVSVFKHLYPSPVHTLSWRGEKIVVDHLYALQEMFEMARMIKSRDELTSPIQVIDVMDKLGVEYE